MFLNELSIGQSAKILTVGGKGSLRQHFLDMGIIPGAVVSIVKFAPMGDPIEIKIHGYELSLRISDAKKIQVEQIKDLNQQTNQNINFFDTKETFEHPCFGEIENINNCISNDKTISFALVGNQNCGKTTLFNRLTGSSQHVGNFPGVTVDRKSGQIKGLQNATVTDLPGIYSMSPYSSEEIVSRNFILSEDTDAIINIVDATNIERNLYLTMQLIEMNIPIVVALNMMDELIGNKGSININKMEALLGVPVVPISAVKNEGIDELIKHAFHVAKYNEKPIKQDFCLKDDHEGAIHRAHHAVESIIEDHAEKNKIPLRFASSKVIEGDKLVINSLNLDENEKDMIEHVVLQMEKESGMDRSAAIADMRYDFIERISNQTVIKPKESKERIRSEKIDKILTGKWTAIPLFICIMSLVFFMTFNVIGPFFQDILEKIIEFFTNKTDLFFTKINVNPVIHNLVIDGIFGGVGSVLSFLPIVVTLFFFLSLMEDSGYVARVAFFMDKLLRKIGLSGRSIVPMLIGFGCTVPAVMSTRTLPSSRDRKMTILLTPFMSCTAKLPIYAFFVSAFFEKHAVLAMTSLYFLGIIVGVLIAFLFKNTLFKGEAVPFVMELPNYRMPGIKNVIQLLWEKAKDFLTKAFTVILLATIVIWFLQSFDLQLNLVEDSSKSVLALISGFIAPIFKPLGLNDWRIVTSLISGIMAKESVVSTMQILFSCNLNEILSISSVVSMLVFSLLYSPCIAAIASIKRELGTKWAVGVVFWQTFIAWIVSFIAKILFDLIF